MSKHKIHLLMFHILYTYNLDIILHSTLNFASGKKMYTLSYHICSVLLGLKIFQVLEHSGFQTL